ncbi:MAG: hypothetical protein WB421_05330 [Terriglobales bacterium]
MSLAMILGVCSLLVHPPGGWLAGRALMSHAAPSLQDSATPDAQQNPAPVQPSDQKSDQKTEPSPDQTQPPAAPPKAKTAASKAAPKKHRRRKKPAAPPTDGPTKVIVKNGGAPDPTVQLSPGVSAEQAARQRQGTDLLLSTTESNLKTLAGRPLNSGQQDMVTQVREYMKQSKTSADAGDLQRAHNLAFKAKLLSDELAKQ